jgi:formylglycine-generating enzyme required for sulfatase activity
MTVSLRRTRDAYIGLDNPTWEEWNDWHRVMLDERRSALLDAAKVDLALYADPATAWSDSTFRQFFLFMYDARFYDRRAGRYRTRELLERWTALFGRIDSVLLWQAYPRLGFDSRTQFDFYRDMPGGLERLRTQVSDELHARNVRVLIDYNPWDAGSYDELGEVVSALDADGVMLDTMTGVPEELARSVRGRRPGAIFAPELRPNDADLSRARQSWAQWFDVGERTDATIYRHRWLVPRHRQFAIGRWDTSRKRDIVYSFFNGSGLVVWDNVFGCWNPYPRADRRLLAETAAVLDYYQELFVHGDWQPLIPTGATGLDANRWTGAIDGQARTIVTLRNRSSEPARYRVPPDAPPGLAYVSFWSGGRELHAGDAVTVEPEGVDALVLDDPARVKEAIAHFDLLSKRAEAVVPDYDERRPRPRPIQRPSAGAVAAPPLDTRQGMSRTQMIDIPEGAFRLTIRHQRRECGCYPYGATDEAMWGWFYKDIVTHRSQVKVAPFSIRATAVTNGEFLEFVHASGYRPVDERNFLKHLRRTEAGLLPATLPGDVGPLPVTFVSLADAEAFAEWSGQRLPTEAEWQWAAEGAGASNRYPWGDGARSFPGELRKAFDPSTATPQGVMGLSGNAWELTADEYTDGHTRFVMLRGGVYLPPGESEWLPARGPRPNDDHAKYLLLSDGLDRSEAVSFRTVMDPQPAKTASRTAPEGNETC